MASPKNTNRSKRKYADQQARTERNKAHRQKRHERLMEKFAARAEALMGKRVDYGAGIGTVTDILYADKGPKRTLLVTDENTGREYQRLRKNVKLV